MSYRVLYIALALVTLSCAPSDSRDSAPRVAGKEQLNTPPFAPVVNLLSRDLGGGSYKLWVEIASAATDAENDTVTYRYAWLRDGRGLEFPSGQTDVVASLVAPLAGDPFATRTSAETWQVSVTPVDAYAEGASATAKLKLTYAEGCEPFPQFPPVEGLRFVDCETDFKFAVEITGPRTDVPHETVVRQALAETVLDAASDDHERFRNFVDLLFKRIFDADPDTTIDHDPLTFRYRPVTAATGPNGMGGFEPPLLFDRSCVDIPLVGTACFHGALYDIDNEAGSRFFKHVASSVTYSITPVADLPATFEIELRMTGSFDVLYEPPTEANLTDVKDHGTSDYRPEHDLSTYVKSHGRARGADVAVLLRVSVPPLNQGPIPLDFSLRVLRALPPDFLEMSAGPYCNNNLGTTDDPRYGGATTDEAMRPFAIGGTANFPGLVSDWTGSYLNARWKYFALNSGPFPHASARMLGTGEYSAADAYRGGGSGVGRDRIGIGAAPFEYNDSEGRWSDNPNNCRRPADACTVTALQAMNTNWVQDGGFEWSGENALCEYPNLSNNGDDATYRISESVDLANAISFHDNGNPFLQVIEVLFESFNGGAR